MQHSGKRPIETIKEPCKECPHCIIEIVNVERIGSDEITDEQARKAGIDGAKELKRLFRHWYGTAKEFLMHEFILR